MLLLRDALAALPYRDLRAIAIRLQLRSRSQHRKEDWLAAIVQAWHDPARRTAWLDRLSPAARAAARRLAQAGELPATLFLAEYGPLRRPGPDRHWTPPPWEAPLTVSEELYYCGLLCPAQADVELQPAHRLEKASRLALPADLRAYCGELPAAPAPPPATPQPPGEASPLLHDAGQILLYLAHHADLRLDHGRWLPVPHLADLNRRLLCPEPAPLPASHKRCRRLRFLWFLITAAGLQADGRLTPLGWTWLAEPRPQQLALL
jgi:hypothetical protein